MVTRRFQAFKKQNKVACCGLFFFFTLPGQHFSLYGKEECGNLSFCGLQRKESFTILEQNEGEKLMTECSFLGGLSL